MWYTKENQSDIDFELGRSISTRKIFFILIDTGVDWYRCNSRSFDIFLSNIRKIYNPYSIVSFHELHILNRAESFFLPTHDDQMVFSFFIIRL
ncbi:hypothetical protein HZS_8155 [Henneguya salminicola]|nr:hypothetical protein HZS_8155 [Henneguya salminicola]